MKEVHPDNYTSVNFGATDDEEEETEERVNDSDSDDEFVDCEEGSWGGNDNIDYDVAAATLSNSFSHVNIERDARLAPKFENETSDIYYKQEWELYHEGGNALFGGIRGVCWRSRYQLELTGIEEVVDLDDARLMFNITSLLMQNTESSNETLYNVLSDITSRMEGDFDSKNEHIRIPRNRKDARSICHDGKFGIFNNLPCPTIHDVGGHACMRMQEVLAQHLAQGRGIDFTKTPTTQRKVTGIHGCQAMSDLLREMGLEPGDCKSFYAGFTTWSDTFLRSFVKQKENNVWMYTLTIPDPNGSATSPYHTYCLAVGAGKLDHTPVIDWYAKEIEQLMRGKDYYCGLTHKYIHLKAGVVAVLADRPEKCFMLKTSLLGTYGQVASWAAEINPDVFPDCKRCFARRQQALLTDRHCRSNLAPCNNCCQWDLNSHSNARKKVPVPSKYPTECCPDSPEAPEGRAVGARFIVPVRQTFEWMIKTVKYAAHNVRSGVWNKGVMTAYLRTCSIAKSVRENVWNMSRDTTNPQSDEVFDSYAEEDGEITDGYAPVIQEGSSIIPALWTCKLLMNNYLDCGMHLIFHGVLAYCVEKMDEFITDHGLTPKFEKLVNAYMLDIKSLRLDWCKMKYFPKKQWLAENELALARIIPFIYGLFFLNLDLPVSSNTSESSKIAVQQMFHAMHVMICVLMSPRDANADEVDEHVKFFLSCCDRFAKCYYNDSVKPFWANTGNFPTLLCLGEQRRRHGPIRWYWEGTSERFIQQLKKVLVSMRKTTQYFSGKLSKMYKTNVMDWLKDRLSGAPVVTERRSARMYFQYESLEEIERKIRLGDVISGFTLKSDPSKLIVAYGPDRRSGIMNCVEVQRLNRGDARKCVGLAFTKVELKNNEADMMIDCDVDCVESCMDHYFLMLPLIDRGNFSQEFALVFEDWDTADENFNKCLPSLCALCLAENVLG